MTNQRKAYLYGYLVVILWSTVSSAFKLSLRYLQPLQLLFISSISSLLVFFFIVVLRDKLQNLLSQKRQDYVRSALLGALNPCVYYIILFKAYSLLPAQEAQALNQTWAIVLPLLSIIILKQKIRLINFVALLISFAGVVTIASHGDIFALRFSNVTGVLLALGSAWVWAFFWLFNLKDTRDIVIKLCTNFLFGAVYITILMVLFHQPMLFTPGILGGIYIGIFEMGLTFVLWLQALQLSKSTAQISNMIYLVPFLALVVIHITIGEHILFSTIIGLVLIIIGIIIQRSFTKQ